MTLLVGWITVCIVSGFFLTLRWWSLVLLAVLATPYVIAQWLLPALEIPDFMGGPLTACPTGNEKLLAISCQDDEAFSFLDYLKKAPNPLPAAVSSTSERIGASLRYAVLADADRFPREGSTALLLVLVGAAMLPFVPLASDGIHTTGLLLGAGFLVAWWPVVIVQLAMLPWRLVTFGALSMLALVKSVASGWVHRTTWRTVQESVFGLTGSPFLLSQLELRRMPTDDGGIGFVYEALDSRAVREAMTLRSASSRAVANSADVVLRLLEEGLDPIEPLADIFRNVDLVHAAYYQADLAIKRVALWFAMPVDERELRAAKVLEDNNLDFSLYKDTEEEFRPATKKLIEWGDALPAHERKPYERRGAFVYQYAGCCHAVRTPSSAD